MKISVTDLDIKKGIPNTANRCPLVLAIKRMVNPNWAVYVSEGTSRIYSALGKCKYYRLPRKAIIFYREFDSGIKVKPFTFTIKGAHLNG